MKLRMTRTPVFRAVLLAGVFILCADCLVAQNAAIDQYLNVPGIDDIADRVNSRSLTNNDITNMLPFNLSGNFVEYIRATEEPSFGDILRNVESLRLNKLVGSGGGASGSTSLLSGVAVPAVLGLGIENGSILRHSDAQTTSLRVNLLGLGRLLVGGQQFPYCPQGTCSTSGQWLRRISGSIAFQQTSDEPPSGSPVGVDALFSNDFRMKSWGVRVSLTGSNDLDHPKYIDLWERQIDTLRQAPEAAALTAAIDALFADVTPLADWRAETFVSLQASTDFDDFKRRLQDRLDALIQLMIASDPDFHASIRAVERAYATYFSVRDEFLKDLQANKMSVEYLNEHPLNESSRSTIRFIYSHQPTDGPWIVTANAAVSFYHQGRADPALNRIRDVQIAAQLDRSLGEIPSFGNAVLTVGAYYQWMKEDALLTIPPGDLAPGTSIALPGEATMLLNTRGHIGVVQGRLSFPLTTSIKVPLSLTWANRTELIKENEVRGQVGLTFDIDSLFQ